MQIRGGPRNSDSRLSEVSALIIGASRVNRSKTDETTPPQPRTGLQSEGGTREALNKGAYAEWYLLNGKALK